MNPYDMFKKKIDECPAIAILRGVKPSEVEGLHDALENGGFTLAEVPLNSPEALESLRLLSAKYDKGGRLLIGAGTVLSEADVVNAAAAGARYIISPDSNPLVIRKTKALGLVSIPGFMTPTEGFFAIQAGADYLKCFPCGRLGPGYIKDLKAVIKTPILAVGGVTASNLSDYLRVADGVGIGSELYKPGKPISAINLAVQELVKALAAHKRLIPCGI